MSQYQTFPDAAGASPTLEKVKGLKLPDMGGRSFLDIGCNEGFFCGFARFLGASKSIGIDKSSLFIERARDRFPDCEFLLQDWTNLPEGEFDVILLASALHYADDQADLIDRLVAKLSPDGVLILEIGIVPTTVSDWVEVDRGFDRRSYPTMKKLSDVLEPYAWKWMGPSTRQPGDPVPRHVVHVSRRKPVAYLLMLPPGYGKSSLASGLFLRAGMPVISGDEMIAAIANGKKLASPDLTSVVKTRYSPFEIDRVIEAAFNEGLGAELIHLLVEAANGHDFALDAFVPVQRHQQVRKALLDEGYFPVALDWERPGLPTNPEGVLLEQLDLFIEEMSTAIEGKAEGSARAWSPGGHIDEIRVEDGVLMIRGWAMDGDGRLPPDWGVRVGLWERSIIRMEKGMRPDVQSRYGLAHQRVGYSLAVKAPRWMLSGVLNDTVEVRCSSGGKVVLTMRSKIGARATKMSGSGEEQDG